MEIFEITKSFPIEEKYSLTDQFRRYSRSVCTCIGEAYRKRKYPKYFTAKITDADGEATETTIWLDFSHSSKYINTVTFNRLIADYDETGKMLSSMAENPEKFLPKGSDYK